MNKVEPIDPVSCAKLKLESIPNEMIQAINELLIANYTKTNTTIKQQLIVKRFMEIYSEPIKEHVIYDNHWLNIEDIYKAVGWNVSYNRPAYDENFDAYFKFIPIKQNV